MEMEVRLPSYFCLILNLVWLQRFTCRLSPLTSHDGTCFRSHMMINNDKGSCRMSTSDPLALDEKTISEDEIVYPMKGSFRGEKDSYSPKPSRNMIEHPHLSPVREEFSSNYQAQSIQGDFPTPDDDIPMVDKIVDASWNKEASAEKPAAISKVPKKIIDAAKDYTTPVCNVETTSKQQQLPAPVPTVPTVSMAEFSAVTKRLGELEDRMRVMSSKPAEIPFEKEQMLNDATSRVDKLETELQATQKALQDALTRQEELLAYVEKKKKRKRGFFWSSSSSKSSA